MVCYERIKVAENSTTSFLHIANLFTIGVCEYLEDHICCSSRELARIRI